MAHLLSFNGLKTGPAWRGGAGWGGSGLLAGLCRVYDRRGDCRPLLRLVLNLAPEMETSSARDVTLVPRDANCERGRVGNTAVQRGMVLVWPPAAACSSQCRYDFLPLAQAFS